MVNHVSQRITDMTQKYEELLSKYLIENGSDLDMLHC